MVAHFIVEHSHLKGLLASKQFKEKKLLSAENTSAFLLSTISEHISPEKKKDHYLMTSSLFF